jgi:acyl-homoserine lactone acylase PvdQ
LPSRAGQRQHEQVTWTIWGPVLGTDYRGRLRALRVGGALRASGSQRPITPLESATTIEEAFDEANGLGTPRTKPRRRRSDGRIGWSVYGTIPRRVHMDGVLPSSWGRWIARLEWLA